MAVTCGRQEQKRTAGNRLGRTGNTTLGEALKYFSLVFKNMGDLGWAEDALFGSWRGVSWVELRYEGDGYSQFAWGGHEKAKKCSRV